MTAMATLSSLLAAALLFLAAVSAAQRTSTPTSFTRSRHILAESTAKIVSGRSSAPSPAAFVPANQTSPRSSYPPPLTNRHRHRVRNSIIGFFAGAVPGIIFGLVAAAVYRMTVNCRNGRYKKLGGPTIFMPRLITRVEHLAFLEKEEGDPLASLEVIGRGGSGEVYKATLPAGSPDMLTKEIAIKKIVKRSSADGGGSDIQDEESRLLDRWMRQIRSEIITVGRIRHRNLLPLAAHVPRPDCHYLVYEYMPNGSLRDALQGGVELPWPARHRVALGAAAGLEYLHFHHRPAIIHRDLKPANILLDDNLEARIADFGLAKELPDERTHATSSRVAGTYGYIAPEYHQTLKFTAKCDVYSFGVILAVLVTGREPSDQFFQSTKELSMVKWVRNMVVSGNLGGAVDPRLAGGGWEEQIQLVLRVACFCTDDDPKARPDSKNVRVMLSQVVNQ